jgi:hypothetical protein
MPPVKYGSCNSLELVLLVLENKKHIKDPTRAKRLQMKDI